MLNDIHHLIDVHWLRFALECAKHSRDPSTCVGSVIARSGTLLSADFNRFPRGVEELPSRMADRELKYQLILHAEHAAVISAGHHARGATMYQVAFDRPTGALFGGPPCVRCAVALIEAGVGEVVGLPMKGIPERWRESCALGLSLIQEAGVLYREISADCVRGIATAEGVPIGGSDVGQRVGASVPARPLPDERNGRPGRRVDFETPQ